MSYDYDAQGACGCGYYNCSCTAPAMFIPLVGADRCYGNCGCNNYCYYGGRYGYYNGRGFYQGYVINPRSAGDDGVNYVYNLPTEALRGDSNFYLHITSAGPEGKHPVVFYVNGTTYPLLDAIGKPVTADLLVEGFVWNIARIEIGNEIKFHTINFINGLSSKSDKGRPKPKDVED